MTESSPWTRWTASRRARISSDRVEVSRCVVLTVVPDVVIVIFVVLYYIRHVVEPRGRSWLMLRCRHVIIASWTRIVDSDVTIVRISVTSDISIVCPSIKVVSHPGLWGIVSLPCLQFIYVRNDWAAVLRFLDQVVNWGKFFYDKVRGILSFPLLLLALEPPWVII